MNKNQMRQNQMPIDSRGIPFSTSFNPSNRKLTKKYRPNKSKFNPYWTKTSTQKNQMRTCRGIGSVLGSPGNSWTNEWSQFRSSSLDKTLFSLPSLWFLSPSAKDSTVAAASAEGDASMDLEGEKADSDETPGRKWKERESLEEREGRERKKWEKMGQEE